MPGRNGMGPWGQGPRTGRGWGWCGEINVESERPSPQPGFGMGRGGGGGMGRRRDGNQMWGAPPWADGRGHGATRPGAFSQRGGTAALREHVAMLERELEALKSRIEESETAAPGAAAKDPR